MFKYHFVSTGKWLMNGSTPNHRLEFKMCSAATSPRVFTGPTDHGSRNPSFACSPRNELFEPLKHHFHLEHLVVPEKVAKSASSYKVKAQASSLKVTLPKVVSS